MRWHAFDRGSFDVRRDVVPLTATYRIGLYGPERSIIDAYRLRYNEVADLLTKR